VKSFLYCSAAIILLLVAVSATAQAPKPKSPSAKAETPAAAPKAATDAATEEIPPAAPDALFPAVVARVNGKPILGRDLEQRIQEQLTPIGNPQWKNLREEYRNELTSQSLGSLIATELLYQKAVGLGIKVTDAEVQSEFAQIAKSYAGDAEMNASLASRGMDRPSLMKTLERSLVVSKFIQENVTKKIVITPAEAAQYYSAHTDEFQHEELVRTSHIFIMIPEGATADQERLARQRAAALVARARKGEDFARLAKENSMDRSASEGGDIGLIPRGQVAPEYETSAFALPVGGISDAVRTQFGYYIIKVTDKKKAGLSTLDEVRQELVDFLKRQRTDTELEKTVNELRGQAKINVYIPLPGANPADATASSPRP
jgi:parvulin-like peptidyl-prolyl isomerase